LDTSLLRVYQEGPAAAQESIDARTRVYTANAAANATANATANAAANATANATANAAKNDVSTDVCARVYADHPIDRRARMACIR
jgi:hypothetical protein